MEEIGNVTLVIFLIIVAACVYGFYHAKHKAEDTYCSQRTAYESGIYFGNISLDDLYNYFLEAGNLGITNVVMGENDTVVVQRNGYSHVFCLKDGTVFIEYPKEGFYVDHGMSGLIHQLKLHQKNLEVVDGNQLMDYLLSKLSSFSPGKLQHTQQYPLAKKWKTMMYASMLGIVVAVCILYYGIDQSANQEFVKYVQQRTVNDTSDDTFGRVINYYLPDAEWEYFTADNGKFIVQVSGTHTMETNGKYFPMVIQFQFMDVEKKSEICSTTRLSLAYLSINGKAIKSSSADDAIDIINMMIDDYDDNH